jgi:hypothetical protein
MRKLVATGATNGITPSFYAVQWAGLFSDQSARNVKIRWALDDDLSPKKGVSDLRVPKHSGRTTGRGEF